MDLYYRGIIYVTHAILCSAGKVKRGYAYRNAVLHGVVKLYGVEVHIIV